MTSRSIQSAASLNVFKTRAGKDLPITQFGFGSAELGNYLRPMTDTECTSIVHTAWDCGIRYFDTAPFYGLGLAEQRLGRTLTVYPRNDYTLATKVGRVFEACKPGDENGGFFVDTPTGVAWHYDYSYDGVMRSYEGSLQRLGVDRIDVLYVHDVDAYCQGSRAASEASIQTLIDDGGWRALEELRRCGEVVALGAGVNEWQPCLRLLQLVDPDLFMLAGRYTLLEQEPATALFPACEQAGARVLIGGPLNSGILAGGDTYNYETAPADVRDHAAKLADTCKRHNVPLPAAALQFAAAHPIVLSVVPGMQTSQEVQANLAHFKLEIPATLWNELKNSGLLPPEVPIPSEHSL